MVSFSQEVDSLKADYTPTGVRIGVDAYSLGSSLANDNLNSLLFVSDVDFYRYLLVGEYGIYERTRQGDNNTYTTNGTYWRIGVDVNFFHMYEDNSVLSLGLRYGRSSFNDILVTNIQHPTYGDQEVTYQNNELSADWYELVLGLKVPVWKFWLGYNMRLKIGVDDFTNMDFAPYEVPGYGLAAEKDYWEFNYYLMYRISWAR